VFVVDAAPTELARFVGLTFYKRGAPPELQLPAEGAVLEGGEERVQLRQGRALRRLQLLRRSYSAGEFVLQLDGGTGTSKPSNLPMLMRTRVCPYIKSWAMRSVAG
jgi:hypothetical protein